MKLTTSIALPLLTVTLSLTAAAQQNLHSHGGAVSDARFGSSVAGGFDVDGDGVSDCLVGAPNEAGNGPMSGAVRVLSGASGAELLVLRGGSSLDMYGSSLAGGDLDGDGRAELIIGAYGDDAGGSDAGAVYVYSGASGRLLFSKTGSAGEHLGFAVAYVPDADGDGLGDVLVGARAADLGATNSGAARLYSGVSGALLLELAGESSFDLFGSAVAGLEDLDGDGRGDLVVGASLSDAKGSGAGSAYVYSGATGALLWTLRGEASGDAFGYAVADAGDVNGDGASDVLVGAPGADAGGQNSGAAYVYSGADGSLLRLWNGTAAGDGFGNAVAGALNLDGDSSADVMVGAVGSDANGASSGEVRVLAGVDGSQLGVVRGASAGARLGAALAGAGDLDHDGLSELLLGAWGEDLGMGQLSGAAHLVSFKPPVALISSYCESNANSTGAAGVLSHTGSSSLGANDLELAALSLPSGQAALFFYGQSQGQVPFGDGYQCVSGQVFRLGSSMADVSGRASLGIDYSAGFEPGGELSAGSSWNFQCWYRDPAGLGAGYNLTDALAISFVR
jgi:hypothetical protein